MGGGAGQVQAACEVALGELVGAFTESSVTGSRGQWAGVVGSLQRVINVASAAQDAAIARLAAIEPEWCEDGTLAESHRGLGHVALDAPAIVSGVLPATARHAECRVRTAVRLAGDGPAGSPTQTGLGGLHAAMRAGRLDAYRAVVVTDELEHAPAEVRATVVAALEPHFEVDDGVRLRRRCRRVLARISPDLLHQRAARARAESKLRRWADEPGVDHWEGTFPSEEAAAAWAAIDALARQYVKAGECATIDRARAKALTDLVAGNATITTTVTVTVPATAVPEQAGVADDAAETHSAGEGEGAGADDELARVGGTVDPVNDDLASAQGSSTSDSAGGADPATAAGRVASSGRVAGAGPATEATMRRAPESLDDPVSAQIGAGDLVQVTGPGAGEPVLVSRQWLADTMKASTVQVAPCHPITGALLDHLPSEGRTGADPVTGMVAAVAGSGATAYTPTKSMARRIRARDRRCRFPGCGIAAAFCDLDHVRPWPAGPTHDTNLLTMCRRHHRVKQRPGWAVTLTPDGITTVTDPTGRVRTSHPVNALTHLTLTGPAGATPAPSTSRARTLVPDGPHTELEYRLEHHAAPPPGQRPAPRPTWRDQHGNTHQVDLLPSIATITIDHDTWRGHRAHSRRPRSHDDDPPPF